MCQNKGFILQNTGHLNLVRLRGDEQTEANKRKLEFTFSRANAIFLLPSASDRRTISKCIFSVGHNQFLFILKRQLLFRSLYFHSEFVLSNWLKTYLIPSLKQWCFVWASWYKWVYFSVHRFFATFLTLFQLSWKTVFTCEIRSILELRKL